MTKERRILDDFNLFLDELTEGGLLIDGNPLVALRFKNKARLSWSASANLAYLFTEHSSIEQYVEVLQRRDFSFCLFDGGLIQVDYTVEDDEVVAHRLCYIPCPFEYEPSQWLGIPLADIPSMMSVDEFIKLTRLSSPIRFDFDSEFSDEKHAHSHLTLNKQTCRIPAYGPISLGHFLRFILRYFYEPQFDAGNWLADVRPKLYTRTLLHPSPHEFHIESAIGFV
ncbi:MAG: hypothetical protein JWR21_1798 [Herminiimonas sp.]|nr:hypothetical protein [Herminiimonas sp.]